uniref:Retrovirus-related Pol polyprotein from transposon TNT 1-94-like beta-barrel domain-containing protein n=1 Tax=Nicotiana tabacum TaxID=4097 RepID=A0A1S4ABM7_TOBAC|nr:PREDICTED: uncharacterized protein LOC107795821 [Nicotiana tabacum]
MVDYLQKMKTLADNLVVVVQPVIDDDLVLHILGGLGPEYDTLVVSVTSRFDGITLADLYGLLLNHKNRLEQMSVLEQGLGKVHVTVKNSNTTKQESNFKRNNNQSQNSFGRYGHGQGRGSGYRSHTSGTQQFTGSNQCQVCSKYGHTSLTYYHLFDHAYQSNSKQNMDVLIAQPSTIIDPSWYHDSGATNNLTNDMSNMDVQGGYNGTEQIHVGIGTCLKIAHVGDSILPSSGRLLRLRNILHIPEITKNLLSIVQFAYDNNVFFEFHPRDCFVKDRTNRKVASSSASSSLPGQPEPTLSCSSCFDILGS